ncbi:alpha-(1,3)-fucosyltransferase 4 [Trichosurus vulpecula]|uniref:alpha-(1,3)-fucosyltransferase 4 n=1 Tax=Trichosurus vulpecula TaxID=9337 RepID=UPI00186B0A61|nr:alpha-(1,3)-fucosyltransferase 4 [Trichosurus vulpecula]
MWRAQTPSGKVRGGACVGREAHLSRARGPGGGEPGVWCLESVPCPLPLPASQSLQGELPRRARRRAELPQYESRYPFPPPLDLARAAAAAAPARPPPPMFVPWKGRQHGRRGGLGLSRRAWLLVTSWLLMFSVPVVYFYLVQPLPWTYLQPPAPAPARPVTVLMWWEPFVGKDRSHGPVPDCQRLFNLSGCRLLTDRKAYWEAQAVLFHHRDLVWTQDWPPPRSEPGDKLLDTAAAEGVDTASTNGQLGRPSGQRWVWMNFESPSNTPRLESLDGSLFNWTLSYRADSDVFVPYGYLYPRSSPRDQPSGLFPSLARKQGLVAWVVSHWNEEQARVKYYYELRRFLQVDVYGQGGPGQPVPDTGLLHTVARYKFYLAFENSQHLDYITEKLWRNSFLAGAVPVVLGPSRANYERFMPRNAFIHVDDFPDAATLATYLRFLDRNRNEYKRYFEWRRRYAVHILSFWDEPWCRTCQALQIAGDQPKKMTNLASWFRR